MFCVIQEVEVKTVPAGEPKGIEVYESRWTADGKEFCSYEYRNSAERFDRPIMKSYRISIHESFRGNMSLVDWHQKRMRLDWKKANWQT